MSCSLRSKLFFLAKLSRRTRAETLARQTKCRVFEIAVMQSMTSMYMSRLAETSHTGRFDHARLPLWSGGLETLYTIFFFLQLLSWGAWVVHAIKCVKRKKIVHVSSQTLFPLSLSVFGPALDLSVERSCAKYKLFCSLETASYLFFFSYPVNTS